MPNKNDNPYIKTAGMVIEFLERAKLEENEKKLILYTEMLEEIYSTAVSKGYRDILFTWTRRGMETKEHR